MGSPKPPRNTEVCLRINIPSDWEGRYRQEYRILFSTDMLFRQAMGSIGSAAASEDPQGKSGWLWSPNIPEDAYTEEGVTQQYRKEALEMLEGLRPQDKYDDWGNAKYSDAFERLSRIEKAQKAARQPRRRRRDALNGSQPTPPQEAVAFSWMYLHRVLTDQMSEDVRAHFPPFYPDLEPTLLFLGPEDESGARKVRMAEPLGDRTVFEFRMLMVELAVRACGDIIWLSHPGEELPLGVRDGEAVEVRWGEGMV